MSDDDLHRHAKAASDALQAIQSLVNRQEIDTAKVRFPRGYLTTVDSWFGRLPWMKSHVIRKNIAYTLMLFDTQRWLLQRTDLSGHAADMIVKSCLASLGSIVEAMLVDKTSPPLGRRQKIPSRIKHLAARGVIVRPLVDELTWLWEMRNRQHLQDLSSREFSVYQSADIARAENAMWAFCDSMSIASRDDAA